MSVVLAAAWLVIPGLLPAVALAGPVVVAVPIAALLTATCLAVVTMLALATDTPALPWFGGVAVFAQAASVLALRRRPVKHHRRGDVVWSAGVHLLLALPLLELQRAVVDWDARSIWIFHARWIYAGSDYFREALTNAAFAFSHPDYPPLVPAAAGTLWSITGAVDSKAAQALTALLTYSAVALLASAFFRLARPSFRFPAAAAGSLVGLAGYGFARGYAMNGYVDLLWAACAASAILFLLVAPAAMPNLVLGCLSLVAAGLTKNEGMIAAVVVLACALLRHRHARRTLLGLTAAGSLVLSWPLLARALGTSSDILEGGRAGALLHGDAEAMSRFRPTIEAMGEIVMPALGAAAVCTLLGVCALNCARRRLGVGSPAWSLAATGAVGLSLLAAYVVSPLDLAYHLESSLGRTTIALRLMLVCEVGVWTLCAADVLKPDRSQTAIGEPTGSEYTDPQIRPALP